MAYSGEALLQARKWRVEQEQAKPTIAGALGTGIGAGIQKGADVGMAGALERRKSTENFVNDLFEKNIFVRVVNPKGATAEEKYQPVPATEFPQIRQALLSGNMPQGIYAIPRKTDTGRVASEQKVYKYDKQTGKFTETGQTFMGYEPKYIGYGAAESAGERTGKTEADIINAIEDNARQTAKQKMDAYKAGILPYDKMTPEQRGAIEKFTTAVSKMEAYGAQNKEPKNKQEILDSGFRAYQSLKNSGVVMSPLAIDYQALLKYKQGMPAQAQGTPAQAGQPAPQTNEVERQTKDGRIAVFDATTKKFLRYK